MAAKSASENIPKVYGEFIEPGWTALVAWGDDPNALAATSSGAGLQPMVNRPVDDSELARSLAAEHSRMLIEICAELRAVCADAPRD